MAQTNPDDILDFDSEFAKRTVNDIDLIPTCGLFPQIEELEEREILE